MKVLKILTKILLHVNVSLNEYGKVQIILHVKIKIKWPSKLENGHHLSNRTDCLFYNFLCVIQPKIKIVAKLTFF